MSEYDGRIVIDSHIDTTRFDLDAEKLFRKAKKISDKLSISVNAKSLGFDLSAYADIIPKNMEKRMQDVAKAAAEIGKPTTLAEIPSKLDSISNSARQSAVQVGNLKNKLIDTVNALYSGKYSDQDKNTLLLAAESAQRALVRKQAVTPESILSIKDSNELNKLQDTFLSKLYETEDVIKKLQSTPLSKATGLEYAKANALGVSKEFNKMQSEINKSELKLQELIKELTILKNNAFNMDMSDFIEQSKTLMQLINRTNKQITDKTITKKSLLSSTEISGANNIQQSDVSESIRKVTDLDKALLSMQSMLNRLSGFSIGKDSSFDKMRAEVNGISDAFNKLQVKVTDNEIHLQTYLDKLKIIKANFDKEKLAPDFDPIAFTNKVNSIIKEIEKYENAIFKLKIEQDALFKAKEISGTESVSESFKKLSNEVSNSNKELNKVSDTAKKTKGSLSGLSGMVSNLKNSFGKSFSGLGKLFGTITRRFNWIVLGQTIRAVINDAKQSIADLRTYSSGFNNTMQSLRDSTKRVGNAIATAFAPVLQALAPIIANVSMWLTNLFNKISLFTNALFTGSKTAVIADTSFSGYSKTADKAAKNTKKGTKAIKDQTKALAKFDKLDVFKKDKNKGTDNSGIGDVAQQAMKMFKTVEVPQEIIGLANKLKDTFKPIGDEFKVIGDSFQNNFVAPIAKHVKENVLPRFAESTKKAIEGMDFSKLNNSLDGFFKVMSRITRNLFDGLEWAWEHILLPMIDKTINDYLPKFLEAVTSALSGLSSLWESSKGILGKLVEWLGDLADPFISGALDGLKQRIDSIRTAIELICPAIKRLGDALRNIHIPQGVKDFFNKLGRFAGRNLFNPYGMAGELIGRGIAYTTEMRTASINRRRIPRFASGTVVSPNKKFLAMLGDNANEQEVVSPVSTMKQAFMEAISETGMQAGSGNVVLQLDGTTFARLMNPYNRAEQNRIGVSMIEGVAY